MPFRSLSHSMLLPASKMILLCPQYPEQVLIRACLGKAGASMIACILNVRAGGTVNLSPTLDSTSS